MASLSLEFAGPYYRRSRGTGVKTTSSYSIELPVSADGSVVLESHARDAGGAPRFRLPLPREALEGDPGVRYLIEHERLHGGYEAATRLFFDEHLAPGDVFVDVGAHWGVFALSAATRWPGQVAVIAVEPHPQNVAQLLKSVDFNGLGAAVAVVAAAAGAQRGIEALGCATSMGHTLDRSAAHAVTGALSVPVVTLDEVLQARGDLAGRRVFLKIDVEGLELEVLHGARALLSGGRVPAIMWEQGQGYASAAGRGRLKLLLEALQAHGFSLHRFPSTELGGPLVPYAPTLEIGNVFALAPEFECKEAYLLPYAEQPPFNPVFALPADPGTRAETTRLLAEVRGSDGARWADPEELYPGAEARARAAAGLVAAGSRVLDLGAGAMALAQELPPRCTYVAADLIARSDACQVVDLNQGRFPPGRYDVVAMLELLEYIHDVPALLARARESADRLVCTYRVREGEALEARRERGWFNDYGEDEFARILAEAGWRLARRSAHDFGVMFVCGR
jgi:FkbM family methyltransferase